MAKKGYHFVIQRLVVEGEIKYFKEIFEYYPITYLVNYLKTNHKTLASYIHKPSLMRFDVAIKIAEFFGIDEKAMFDLIHNQIIAEKKRKK
jgi:hypothetical protein